MLGFFMNAASDQVGTIVIPGFVSISTNAPMAQGSTSLDIDFLSNGAFGWTPVTSGTITPTTFTRWIDPTTAGIGNGYDIRLSSWTTTFTTIIGPQNTWLNLGTNRSWTFDNSDLGNDLSSFTIEIRDTFTTTIVSTTTFTIDLNYS